jgi:hypothetical protein
LRFEAELRAAGEAARTIHTYVDRAERFLGWLVGDYDPTRSVNRPAYGSNMLWATVRRREWRR